MSYREADRELTNLLSSFGPHRKVVHTEAPFWRLQNDGVWEIRDANQVIVGPGGNAHKSSLLRQASTLAFRKPLTQSCETMRSLRNGSLVCSWMPIFLRRYTTRSCKRWALVHASWSRAACIAIRGFARRC